MGTEALGSYRRAWLLSGAAQLPPIYPSPGSPPSVGSKGGFLQAKVGPVDGQSLSVLSSRVQAKPGETKWQIVTGQSLNPLWQPPRQPLTLANNSMERLSEV